MDPAPEPAAGPASGAPTTPRPRLRSARGLHRRGALLAAAADLLLEQGVSAVTHRAVASRAVLPLAATTYYFASLQDLRDQALVHLADRWIERGQAVVRSLPPRLDDRQEVARAVVGVVTGDKPPGATPPEHLMAMYERYLEAGRHPRLRPLVVAYNDQLADLAREVLRRGDLPSSPQDVRLSLAVVDGALLTALAEGKAPDRVAATALITLFNRSAAQRM